MRGYTKKQIINIYRSYGGEIKNKIGEEKLIEFFKEMGIEVEEENSKLEEAREYKLLKKIYYKKEHHSMPGYGDADFDSYTKGECYGIQEVDTKIDLYEQDRQELINKMKCCGNCKYKGHCQLTCDLYNSWELK